MSVKPIDLQVMIPKTSEISKMASEHNNKNVASNQQQASNFRNTIDRNLKQVYSREDIQNAKVREKQEKNKEGGKKERKDDKNKDSKQSKNKTKSVLKKSNTIDIRL